MTELERFKQQLTPIIQDLESYLIDKEQFAALKEVVTVKRRINNVIDQQIEGEK